MTILIVDDDEDDKNLFIESVKEVNKEIICVTASDGQEALRLLKDESKPLLPDYIFLDLRMPRVSGKQCLEEIRKDNRLREIPVFIYTTSRDVDDSIELTKNGAVHFISKPTNPDEVYYILSTVLYEKWEAPSPCAPSSYPSTPNTPHTPSPPTPASPGDTSSSPLSSPTSSPRPAG